MLSNQKLFAMFLATLILFGVTSTAAETQKSNIKIAKLVNLDVLDEVTANSAAIETLSTTSQNLIKTPESINNYSKLINNEYPESELTGKIIGCAMEVHRILGNGFQEVYPVKYIRLCFTIFMY